MFSDKQLVQILGYENSSYYSTLDNVSALSVSSFLFSIPDPRFKGVYFIRTVGNERNNEGSLRPAIYIAEARDVTESKEIHNRLWNFGYAPFLIVTLPNRIHIYSGFDYSEEDDTGLLEDLTDSRRALRLLQAFSADSVDTGELWETSFARKIKPANRVDRRLLRNLSQLGDLLITNGLRPMVAHALIGKYVYFSYLRDKGIIDVLLPSDTNIVNAAFSSTATIADVRLLTVLLERKLNGNVFDFDFDAELTLNDQHVSWVASVFSGDEPITSAPQDIWQLHLPFRAYDFEYIPVETLSTIYEQFIHDKKKKGVVYTPEVLADYLISEIEQYKDFSRGLKVFDPACGSGIFLVIAYRRLIEKEITVQNRWLSPMELVNILTDSIYGVERELEACYVAEFSLLLTLLHYTKDYSLLSGNFQFPSLHNFRIFHGDFFDDRLTEFDAHNWEKTAKYDVIVGNPPWIELKPDTNGEYFVRKWLEEPSNRKKYPVGGNRVAEAFSWKVIDFLVEDGVVGLVMPATSLFNLESHDYRKAFFLKNTVLAVANFANLRDVMFGRRGTMPAASIVYKPFVDSEIEKPRIIHYAPFRVNQIMGSYNYPWIITVNESEIQTVNPIDAETGESVVWKLALWGDFIDRRTLDRIKRLFPMTLEQVCANHNWPFYQGPEFRSQEDDENKKLAFIEELVSQNKLISKRQRMSLRRLTVAAEALVSISHDQAYLRRGREALSLTYAPHILISYVWLSYLFYSDRDFVIPTRHFGIAGSIGEAYHLKSLALYLNSSLVSYYMFFYSQQWGVFRQARQVSLTEVRKIPIPEFSPSQTKLLAEFYDELANEEINRISRFVQNLQRKSMPDNNEQSSDNVDEFGIDELGDEILDFEPKDRKLVKEFAANLRAEQQALIDAKISEVLTVPNDIQSVVNDFFNIRLPLDRRGDVNRATRKPTEFDLSAYAKELLARLDSFGRGRYTSDIKITSSPSLVECVIEFTPSRNGSVSGKTQVVNGDQTRISLFGELSRELKQRVSQWIYVQKGLRLFEGPKVFLYKTARLIDWTRTQAMADVADILSDIALSD